MSRCCQSALNLQARVCLQVARYSKGPREGIFQNWGGELSSVFRDGVTQPAESVQQSLKGGMSQTKAARSARGAAAFLFPVRLINNSEHDTFT